MELAELRAPIAIPAALRDYKGFLVWKREETRKIPYYVTGSKRSKSHGSSADIERLADVHSAQAAYRTGKYEGLGFAPLKAFGVIALDFDKCIDSEGVISPGIAEALDDTYYEVSPSGRGLRAFYTGDLGEYADRKSGTQDHPYGLETFCTKGYVTITGSVHPFCRAFGNVDTLAPVNERVRKLLEQRFGDARRPPRATGAPPSPAQSTDRLRDSLAFLDPDCDYDTWLKVGLALHYETDGDDLGLDLWNEWSEKGSKYQGYIDLHNRYEKFSGGGSNPVTGHFILNQPQVIAADFAAIDDTTDEAWQQVEKAQALKFPVIPAHEFVQRPPPAWRVQGVLPETGLGVLFGESGSGKSFVALDLAVAVGEGTPWRDRPTRQGRVVVVCAEGAAGFRNRVVAAQFQRQFDLTNLPLGVMADAPNFLTHDVKAVLASVEAFGGADLLIIDTFAQVTPGANENSAEDMGKALAHCRQLYERLGCLVLLIHHAGKDVTRGARGWSGLKAAADVELEVAQRVDGLRRLKITKMKDGQDGDEFWFRLAPIDLGLMPDGVTPMGSCVIEAAGAPASPGALINARPKGLWQRVAWDVICDLAAVEGAAVEAVLAECLNRSVRPEGRDQRRDNLRRALTALQTDGWITLEGDFVECAR